MGDDKEARVAAVMARLRALVDDIDEQTRRPGEPPLRQQMAEQAREELTRLNERRRHD